MARDGTEWETKEDKICTTCGVKKSYDSFSVNQYGKHNRILRRPVCIKCYSKKKKIPHKLRKEYEIKYPRPKKGTIFHCPVCDKKKEHKHNNDICLDHNHETGKICRDNNANVLVAGSYIFSSGKENYKKMINSLR